MGIISRSAVFGTWLSGPNVGKRQQALDVRAGMLYTEILNCEPAFGSPSEFRADTGETGDGLLALLLPWPRRDDFFRGVVRESLAAASCLAQIGRQETRAWELPNNYIVDDGEGGRAVVSFTAGGCVAAMCSDECPRDFDDEAAAEQAPAELREALRSVCRLPFFEWEGRPRLTAVFWGLHETLDGPEPWPTIYNGGAEVLRHELLSEDFWRTESASHYDLQELTVDVIVHIARRAVVERPTLLTEGELAQIVPPGSAHYDEAVEELLGGGAFRIA
jgi:hypothetical protein